jgi:hypothetical protein
MSRADDINDDEHIDSPMVGDDEFIVDAYLMMQKQIVKILSLHSKNLLSLHT